MLIPHFSTLQNKELSGFVRFREANAEERDDGAADLYYLLFLLGSMVIFSECRLSEPMCHPRFSSHKKSKVNAQK